jgi:hypothetical protein
MLSRRCKEAPLRVNPEPLGLSSGRRQAQTFRPDSRFTIQTAGECSMSIPRVLEMSQGIQGEFNVTLYDQMQRRLRDKGWIETKDNQWFTARMGRTQKHI